MPLAGVADFCHRLAHVKFYRSTLPRMRAPGLHVNVKRRSTRAKLGPSS